MPELFVYDEIVSPAERKLWGVGVDAESFAVSLKAAGDGDLHVHFNSPGGSAWEGMAMHSLLMAERAKGRKVIAHIDGACLSAATLPAAAADEVRAGVACEYMIHNPSLFAYGDAGDMRKAAERLDTTKAAALAAYRGKTGHSDDTLAALMTAETWLTPEKAKELRFVDVVEAAPERAAQMSVPAWRTRPLRHPAALAAYERMSARPPSLSAPSRPRAGEGPSFPVATRVRVLGTPHMKGQASGEVREAVLTYAYGVLFDGMEEMGIHHWYVESELSADGKSANKMKMSASAPSQGAPPMPTPTEPEIDLVPKAELAAAQTELATLKAQHAAAGPILAAVAKLTGKDSAVDQIVELAAIQGRLSSLPTAEQMRATERANLVQELTRKQVPPTTIAALEAACDAAKGDLSVLRAGAAQLQPPPVHVPAGPARLSDPPGAEQEIKLDATDLAYAAERGIPEAQMLERKKAGIEAQQTAQQRRA